MHAVRAVEADPAIVAELAAGFEKIVGFSSAVIGALPEPLSAARPDIRIQEMPIGNVVCDAMLEALFDNVRPSGQPRFLMCACNTAATPICSPLYCTPYNADQ